MLCSLIYPSCRHFASTRCCPLIGGRCRTLVNKTGGRELDGFNGNVIKNLVLHSETVSRTKISFLAKKDDILRKQTQALKRFIPQPIFGKIKSSALKTKDMKFDNVHEVNRFILDHLSRCSTGNIADLMHISVKVTKKSKKISYLKVHLPVIASKLKTFSAAGWKFRDISTIIYGLQCFSEDDDGLIDILSLMTDLAAQGIAENQQLKSQDISMLLLGIQEMSSTVEAVPKLLSVITKMVSSCGDNFDEQNIGNALFGLKNMTNDCEEVKSLLSAITIKILGSSAEISSQAVNNSLLGLQNMNSDCTEVRALISALAIKIKQCKPELSTQALSNSFYCLQGMSDDSPEICELLSALTIKAKQSLKHFNSQEIGNAIYGLQRMGANSSEVRDVLFILLTKLKYRKGDMTGHAVCDSLYGLQGMNNSCPEVKELLSALIIQIQDCRDELNENDISNALYGLLDLFEIITKEERISILNVLFQNVNRIVYVEDSILPNLHKLKIKDLVKLHESITFTLIKLSKILKQNHYKSWEKINRFLADEITLRRRDGCDYYDQKNIKTKSEIKLNSLILKLYNDGDVLVKSNNYLFDLFRCDFLFKIPTSNMADKDQISTSILNIEICDSTRIKNKNDNNNNHQKHCVRRDQYLHSKGITVVRVESSSILSMNEEELETWITRILSNAKSQHTSNMLRLSNETNAINDL